MLLDRGIDPGVRAAIDADGFGGYTVLHSTVVAQRKFWVNYPRGSRTKRASRVSSWIVGPIPTSSGVLAGMP